MRRNKMNRTYKRYITITADERNALIATAKAGTTHNGMSVNIWERGNKRRLYVNWTNHGKHNKRMSTWIDVNDEDDNEFDFGGDSLPAQAMDKFEALMTEILPDEDTEGDVELGNLEVSAIINMYEERQASVPADLPFAQRGIQRGFLKAFGVNSARLTDTGREWVRKTLLPEVE
jgi:hypothetical protein